MAHQVKDNDIIGIRRKTSSPEINFQLNTKLYASSLAKLPFYKVKCLYRKEETIQVKNDEIWNTGSIAIKIESMEPLQKKVVLLCY